MMADEKGVDITYTPFDDEGVLQLLGGHIDFILENPGQVFKFVKSWKNENFSFICEITFNA